MKIREVMNKNIIYAEPDMTIDQVAQKMRDQDVGILPVMDNDRPVGMVTDRDITNRAVAENKMPKEVSVRDVMTPGMVACTPDATVEEAAQLMKKNKVRRLAVMDDNKKLAGLVTYADLTHEKDKELGGEILSEVTKPD